MSVTILDCTFRDGGYYNKWDFPQSLVNKYIDAASKAGANVLEMGLRGFPSKQFLGAHAYTTDHYLSGFSFPDTVQVGVMVDAKHIVQSGLEIDEAISLLFTEKEESPVDIVRVAIHLNELNNTQKIVKKLTSLGYQVCVNLMQVSNLSDEDIVPVVKEISSWDTVDVLYFADSLGNMDANDISRVIRAIRTGWQGELGIHTHDNMGRAIHNTLTAIEQGVRWVDATLSGMGRGAGNAQTEILLLELEEKFPGQCKANELYDIVLNDISLLMRKYQWGKSVLYHLAASYDIHPSYIQEMVTDGRYSSGEIIAAIEYMKPLSAKAYNKELLFQAKLKDIDSKGSWSAKNWCKGKEILLLGSGESLNRYQEGIVEYIKAYQPFVISLNIQHDFPAEYIDAYAAANGARIMMEVTEYHNLVKPFFVSQSSVSKIIESRDFGFEIRDYGLSVEKGVFILSEKECTLPYALTFGYAIAIATIGGASSINLVGFDGYSADDQRQIEMNELLSLYQKDKKGVSLVSLTPSNYPVEKSSIYAPKI